MTRLSDRLTRPQEVLIERGFVELRVDLSPAFPGCFVASKGDVSAAGSTARLAVEGLLGKLKTPKG